MKKLILTTTLLLSFACISFIPLHGDIIKTQQELKAGIEALNKEIATLDSEIQNWQNICNARRDYILCPLTNVTNRQAKKALLVIERTALEVALKRF